MKKLGRRGLCLGLALIMAAAMAGCRTELPAPASTQPTAAETRQTVPTTVQTEPPETQPPETQPPETEPPQTQPPETEPPETQPPETEPPAIEAPKITAQKAFVYDCRTEEYLYLLGEPSDSVFPASTTKLFTCYVGLQYLDPSALVTVGSEIDLLEPMASTAGLSIGDTLTVEALISCILLPSGCDAAYTLAAAAGRVIAGNAELTPREAVDVFVEQMNRKVGEYDLENTHFVTCDGYHRENHYISLSAFVKIGKLCLANPIISGTARLASADVTTEGGRTLHLTNLNEVLNANSQYYRENCVGLKTGRTDSAGSCMLAAFREDGGYVLIGVFKGIGMEGRYSDVDALYDTFVRTE